MKATLQTALARMRQGQDLIAKAALVPAVALMSSPVMAALPKMPTPGTGIGGQAVQDGDWLAAMGAWWKQGLTIFSDADIADLKEYVITGSVLAIALVVLAGYAMSTLE